MITKFHNLLVIALVIIRRTHKAHRADRGAENPTGPKLPDVTLLPNVAAGMTVNMYTDNNRCRNKVVRYIL